MPLVLCCVARCHSEVSPVAPCGKELKLKLATGAAIESVKSGSPAEEAGLQAGDVIHRLNRMSIANAQELTAAVRALPNYAEVVLQIERGGQLAFVTVKLAK